MIHLVQEKAAFAYSTKSNTASTEANPTWFSVVHLRTTPFKPLWSQQFAIVTAHKHPPPCLARRGVVLRYASIFIVSQIRPKSLFSLILDFSYVLSLKSWPKSLLSLILDFSYRATPGLRRSCVADTRMTFLAPFLNLQTRLNLSVYFISKNGSGGFPRWFRELYGRAKTVVSLQRSFKNQFFYQFVSKTPSKPLLGRFRVVLSPQMRPKGEPPGGSTNHGLRPKHCKLQVFFMISLFYCFH